MGPGESATNEDKRIAFETGQIIALLGHVTLSGGRKYGVMDAVLSGAKNQNGLTVGVLPGKDTGDMSPYVDVPIVTGMGHARNAINILSSDVVIAIGEGAGTLSEIALTLKSGKPIILFNISDEILVYLNRLKKNRIYSFADFDGNTLKELLEELTKSLKT